MKMKERMLSEFQTHFAGVRPTELESFYENNFFIRFKIFFLVRQKKLEYNVYTCRRPLSTASGVPSTNILIFNHNFSFLQFLIFFLLN